MTSSPARRLHRRTSRRLAPGDRRAGRQPRQAHLLGQLGTSRRSRRRAHAFVRANIGDRAVVAELLAAIARARVNSPPRRRRPLDPRARRVREDQRAGHVRAARGGARALDRAAGGSATRSGSCTCRPTRSTARSAPTSAVLRDDRVRAQQPVLGVEGLVRHFVRAYRHTYGLPTVTTNCSTTTARGSFPRSSSR